MNETATTWRTVIHLMRNKEESVGVFILRFETAEAILKCCNIELSSLNLAIHLIETLNVMESQKKKYYKPSQI